MIEEWIFIKIMCFSLLSTFLILVQSHKSKYFENIFYSILIQTYPFLVINQKNVFYEKKM